MKRFNIGFLPTLKVKGYTDGSIISFDRDCPDTMQTLDILDSGENADLAMERLVETIFHVHQIKVNMSSAKKAIKRDIQDIYDNWDIK